TFVAVSNLSLTVPTNDILTGPEAGGPVLHIFQGTNGETTYSTKPINLLAFRHGSGIQLATRMTVNFSPNSPVFGVSSVAFGSFTNGTTRDIIAGTGIGLAAYRISGPIPNPLRMLNDPNLPSTDTFVQPVQGQQSMFAGVRAPIGVFVAGTISPQTPAV